MNQSAFSVRMDSQLKYEFSLICEDFGMSVSTAITLFAKAVVREHRIPFEIKSDLPNGLTRQAIELAENGKELHGPFSTISDLRASLDA
ncbi:type II toxin-antitoxin system RelB/DinJ family antitoxin [Treponema sp. Marseille-Q4132]|uniref:type II toxin-antitoxin system RelB/DinJ family antitoxin n=1 Tax=Treponema sp. Marseille-Q4132 TaxID=2766701 RepID=UPI0016532BC1|nr:type II toxin-antitoxin system RelB/DinJ family antitoxin [Treponema sp. Marseille-Q4132]QNL98312.1 type II toxin-antitoxin system RelB/DinJ family antitoxin [Treponema sp. Marseille-Q4132]